MKYVKIKKMIENNETYYRIINDNGNFMSCAKFKDEKEAKEFIDDFPNWKEDS